MVCVLRELLGEFVMSSCEKCWCDADRDGYCRGFDGKAESYHALLKERDGNGVRCTPEEQAGPLSESNKCMNRISMVA